MTTTSKKLVPNIRFPEFEKSGEWVEKKLDNIGNFFRGHSYSKKDVSTEDNGNTIVLRSNNIDEYRINYNDLQYVTKKCRKEIIVKNNDIIICMSNGSANLVGKNAYIRYDKIPHDKKIDDKDITVGAFCGIYRTENQIVKYFFQSDFYKKQLQTLFAGSNINNLKGTDILSMYIYTPTSSQEQQKIADFLSSVDELIELEQKKLEELQEYKQGLLQNLFPKKNQKVPDLRFQEFKNGDDWKENTISELFDIQMCRRIYKNETSEIGDIPFYKIGTIGRNADAFITKELYDEYRNKYNYPRLKETLITCSGTIGKCIQYNGEKAYFQDSNIVWLRPYFDIINLDYLYIYISNMNWGNLAKTTITRLYTSILKETIIVFPSLKEQQKIADFLLSVDKLIVEQTTKLNLLYDYKKGLLQQLFPN